MQLNKVKTIVLSLIALLVIYSFSVAIKPTTEKATTPNGNEVKVSNSELDEWFQKGKKYVKNKDYAKAKYWYKKAAEQGDYKAQTNLGMMYDTGQGVPKDYAKARYWYKKAAEQGIALAQYDLGLLYYNGHGVPKDYAKARYWFEKAAEQGLADAQINLGMMYSDGYSLGQDYAKAYMFFNLAAKTNPRAAKYRGKLDKIIPQKHIEEGQRLTRQWLQAHPTD